MRSFGAVLLILITVAIGGASCSVQKGEAKSANVSIAASVSDPELASALSSIQKTPESVDPYVRLAGIYIRRARETGDFSLNSKAEMAIEKALELAPNDISSRKLQASLDLTFHRFSEGLAAGKALQTDYPNDAFVYGILTDANAELGNYDEAVAAAQKMVDLKPNATSYARVGHLRSLYGDHIGAVEMFSLAAQIADPVALEAKSWYLVQLGDEYFKHGQFPESEKAYDQALANFPNYYFALAGKGRVRAANGDIDTAITLLTDSLNRVPNVETAISLGDAYSISGKLEKAQQQYDLVQVIEQKIGVNTDQKRLALLWADHDVRIDEANVIAEREYASRKDIFTADTAAWCRFKKGDLASAKAAIDDAMRLKTNDPRMLYHAGMIASALGDHRGARKLLKNALRIDPSFDLIQAAKARTALEEMK